MIIIITGPTGSGKSTVAKILCKKFERCVRLDVDRVKHFVENGFGYDDSPEGKTQWALCVKNIIALANNFSASGYTIVIEGYLGMESPGWPEVFTELSIDRAFVLLPSDEVLKKRNRMRTEQMQMDESDVLGHVRYFSAHADKRFFMKDSSDETAEETAQWIYGQIVKDV